MTKRSIMDELSRCLYPDRTAFKADPFGYSSLALERWKILQDMEGSQKNLGQNTLRQELNSPELWLCQAQALTEAAITVLKNEPDFKPFPKILTGICDSQYCAVGIMLAGYSLEVCLKGMLIRKESVDGYLAQEKDRYHHRLEELGKIVPALSDKDKSILRLLTEFITWAGRYPAPKPNKENCREEIFSSSEAQRITAYDLIELCSRVVKHGQFVVSPP